LVDFQGRFAMVNNDLAQVMRDAAERSYPAEACGVVISVGKKSIAVECKNIAVNPNAHFMIDPVDYCAAADRGEVVGIWHTHPELSPQPSDADRVGCEASELPWFIIGINKVQDSFTFEGPIVVEPSGFEMDYVGRPYVFGVLDCYSLVRDYYRRERGIKMGEYPRIDRFWNKGHDFFLDNFKNEGFERVEDEPKEGDLFIMQVSAAIPNHIGIYIGNDQMLHHCDGRLSRRDIYGGYWLKHTVAHIRLGASNAN
jgi:proteasome lid subunit RPN8/RPN11